VSGYLQRIASRVLSPSPSIHPIVGSIFSSPQRDLSAAESQSDEQPATPSMAVAQPLPPAPGNKRDSGRKAEGNTGEVAAFEIKPLVERSPGPLSASIPETHTEPKIAAFEPLVADRRTREGSTFHDPQKESGELGDSAREISSSGDRPYSSPVEALPVRPVVPKVLAKNRNDPAPAAARNRNLGRPMPAEFTGREPDQIQIHIGRIEVTAAPPSPAPRPAAAPARKSVNLDEYLKRRDRRVQ
jgi:hypothetical protein